MSQLFSGKDIPSRVSDFLGTCDALALHLRHQSWGEGMPSRGTPFRASHSIPPPHITLVRGAQARKGIPSSGESVHDMG